MSSVAGVSPERKTFSKIKSFMDLPNLIDVQRRSYERFLQMNLLPEEREESGLQAVFTSVFPFSDFRGACELQFVKYAIGNWECKCGRLKGLEHLRMDCRACGARIVTAHPHEETVSCPKCGTQNPNRVTLCDVCGNPVDLQMKYSVAECQERGMTYSVPLKVTFRLFVYDKDPDTGVKTMRDAKEEEVFFGDIPLMTEHGTFVINGTERVIVSQLHRSPGVFFTKESAHGFLAKIIPYRGSWVEFEYDQKGILFVRIDRKRKFPATIFLRALGLETDESILREFYAPVAARFERGRAYLTIGKNVLKQEELKERYARVKRETKVIFAGIKLSADEQKEIARKGAIERSVDGAAIEKACFIADVVDLSTGEVLFEAGQEVGPDAVEQLKERGIKEVEIFFPDWDLSGDILVNTIRKDTHKTKNEAILEIYRRLRPGDPPTYESAKNLFNGMFFDPKKYDFSRVGRFKFNIKLEADSAEDTRTLTAQDIYRVVAYLLRLKRDVGRTDDIDNLGNRRVRSVGELLENQFRIGLVRMERAIKEKMSVHQDIDSAMPHDLINSKPVIASIKEFFGSSQLSQFMDQTNPLSEVTHKRRLSALGPGGLSRERAGFEVRDVHPTHYGRVCPIETPEGPNIGLISSLSCYARINDFGFIETPYKRVEKGRVIDHFQVTLVGETSFKLGQIVEKKELEEENERVKRGHKRQAEVLPYSFYLSAWEEENFVIAQANAETDAAGRIKEDRVIARFNGEFITAERDKVDYKDISPKQLVSVATALIPFLEHDDANRALMGSNMQRQAVPLLKVEAPLVGTGLELTVARDSGAVVLAKRGGIVDQVDSERIIVRVEGSEVGRQGVRRGHLPADEVPPLQPEHLHQPEADRARGADRRAGPGPGRRPLHAEGGARARPQHPGRLHAVARLQLRGRDPRLRAPRQGRLLHLDPHPGVRHRGPRHQARAGGDHARHPQRLGERAAGPGRVGHHPHRRHRQAGRHPGRQGHPEGGDAADAGREAPARDLRREGRRRARRVPEVPAGHRGHGRGRQDLLAQGDREGPAGALHRAGPDREDREELQGRDPDHPGRGQQEDPGPPRREDLQRADERPGGRGDRQEGGEVHRRRRRAPLPPAVEAPEAEGRRGRRGGADHPAAPGLADRGLEPRQRRADRAAPEGGRAAAGRHQDGQGLRRDEEEALRRRQDGGPPRQQGGHLADPGGRRHAVPAGRDPDRHRAEPPRRPLPDERRPDPGDAPGLGRARCSACTSRRRSSTAPRKGRSRSS